MCAYDTVGVGQLTISLTMSWLTVPSYQFQQKNLECQPTPPAPGMIVMVIDAGLDGARQHGDDDDGVLGVSQEVAKGRTSRRFISRYKAKEHYEEIICMSCLQASVC